MSIKTLDGNRFADMIVQGANHLSENAAMVDALNVFPVPDGDTGTNMNLSMTSGSKEVQQNRGDHIGKVAQALSKGLLMGARGNSGVILSQLFRGFSKHIEKKPVLSSAEFAEALDVGVMTAYKAVMKPVEGTILTVAKDAAKKAVEIAATEDDLVVVMEETLKEAKASLKRTPDLLPVLKEVGVVDSGGQGLVCVYEGFLSVLTGEALPTYNSEAVMDEMINAEHHHSNQDFMSTEDIVYGYCTEFMVRFEENKKSFNEETFRNDLSEYGDSLLVIADEEVAKVHIHSEEPGDVLTYGQQYGSLIKMKIENMREQHSAIVGNQQPEKAAEKSEYGIIAVSMGEGIAELYKSLGVSVVIEGGQTMNPSTEDIVKAVKDANAEKIIILPNNKNIIMAAEQAAEIAEESVVVVPSKTVPQGLAAVLAFNPGAEIEQNKRVMTSALDDVKTGSVTHAVRDTQIDGLTIKENDFMGMNEGKIVQSEQDLFATTSKLLKQMINEDSEIITILYGQDCSEEILDQVVTFIEENYEEIEIEVHNGKQPLYPFMFSIE